MDYLLKSSRKTVIISFFGSSSTKGELAQKLDRDKDAAVHRWLTQVPPEPCEMVAYYTTHKLYLGWEYLSFIAGTTHTWPLGLVRGTGKVRSMQDQVSMRRANPLFTCYQLHEFFQNLNSRRCSRAVKPRCHSDLQQQKNLWITAFTFFRCFERTGKCQANHLVR